MIFDTIRHAFLACLLAGALVLGGPSCATHTDGVEVLVGLQSVTTPAFFDTDLGYRIELDAAYVDFASAELLPCATTRWEALLTPSVARAHTGASPTVLGEPHVVDLLGSLGAVEHVGTLLPPPGAYCGVVAGISPADADAVGLPSEPNLVGVSVHLSGTITPPGGVPRSFEVQSASETQIELSFAAPVTLDLDAPLLSVVVTTDHLSWLDGIDFDALSAGDAAAALFANLIASTSVATEIP